MNNRKKIPMRKCVASQEMKPKKELIRIVRSKEGEVTIDLTGKKSGRGAYLARNKDSILLARKKDILSRHLEVAIDDSLYDELLQLVEMEQE
ncbi:RNase P modulator RnpM [Sutcliffiella rhizosphaerae]|uniref:YlxR domain-containing protein n=1 Tax=Sutcliffiella rhizosphaerae TaxID=2880967 RepID=A0ABN8A9I8_9BACI|nr:YlxR family protein [Sutcliffiella rhizosphaerae]CAG9619673.1 hypothetical protein BACCIP111883_00441 [Sutcliffiella rhizosphaerae]